MALLPLAGFAEAITESMFIVSDVVYGTLTVTTAPTVTWAADPTEPLPAGISLTKDAGDNVVFFKKVGDEYVAATAAADHSPAGKLDAGTYYVQINGTTPYSGSIYKPLIVSPKPIVIKFTGANKTYGQGNPEDNVLYASTWTTAPLAADEAVEGFLTGFKYGTLGTETAVLRNNTGVVIAYPITATCTDPNYSMTVDPASEGFKINPKNIPTEDVKYTFNGTGTWTYNGAAQTTPTITVTGLNAADYAIEWYKEEGLINKVDAPTNAGDYYAKVVGIGNYGSSKAKNTWKFTIGQRTAMAYVQPMEKIYDGEQIEMNVPASIKGAQLVFTNLASADNTAEFKAKFYAGFKDAGLNGITYYNETEVNSYNAGLTGAVSSGDHYYFLTEDVTVQVKTYYTRSGEGTAADPYVYTDVASPTDAGLPTYYEQGTYDEAGANAYNATLDGHISTTTVKEFASPKDAGSYMMKVSPNDPSDAAVANYKFSYMEVGSYTIIKRKVTVKAVKQTFTYTGSDIESTVDVWTDGMINLKPSTTEGKVTVDIEAAQYVGGVLKNNTGVLTGENVLDKITLTLKAGEGIEHVNVVKNYPDYITVGQTAAVSNYEIVENKEGNFGDIEVEGKSLILIASTFDKEYGYVLNNNDLSVLTDNPNIKEKDLKAAVEYEVTYTDAQGTHVVNEGDLMTIGDYTITIKNATALAPTNYTITPANVFVGNLTITKKALKVTVKNQTLGKDAAATELLQGENYVEFTGLVNDEIVQFDIVGTAEFAAAAAVVTDNDHPAQAVITINMPAEATGTDADDYSNSHYTLAEEDITKGKLIVVGANTIVLNRNLTPNGGGYDDPSVNTAATLIANAAAAYEADGTKYNVTFDAYKMIPQKWYTLVLPFETSVAEISQKFGYAVVDVFDTKNNNTDNVHFSLHMGKIEANQPFIVKVVNSNIDDIADDVDMSAVTFTGKVIKNSTDPSVKDATTGAPNKFIGVYGGKYQGFNPEVDYVFGTSATATTYQRSAEGFYIFPLSAYIKFGTVQPSSNARLIIIDEPDGSTTAIDVLTNEVVYSKAFAEGWYTLNGVKLQSVPTTKGIYINNGKKVVIK